MDTALSNHLRTELEEVRPTAHAPGMSREPPRRATLEDLDTVPPEYVGEIVDGMLYTGPRPASRHARAVTKLATALDGPFDEGVGGPGGWIILFEPRLNLGEDSLVPDLAGWRRERMPELPEVTGFSLAPDWVCEALSPSTEELDRETKARIYAREGVRHLWLVDPVRQTLEVYRLEGRHWNQQGTWSGQVTVQAEPFEVLALELGRLWAR